MALELGRKCSNFVHTIDGKLGLIFTQLNVRESNRLESFEAILKVLTSWEFRNLITKKRRLLNAFPPLSVSHNATTTMENLFFPSVKIRENETNFHDEYNAFTLN